MAARRWVVGFFRDGTLGRFDLRGIRRKVSSLLVVVFRGSILEKGKKFYVHRNSVLTRRGPFHSLRQKKEG